MTIQKVGILRETKSPADPRVPFSPANIAELQKKYPELKFYIQPSKSRCFSDKEYEDLNICLKEDLSDCDLLMGIKEVDKTKFIKGKTYMFFPHVAKKQSHNQAMFQEMARKNITLIDYEYLTGENGKRIVGFGRWAGIVGAYKGIRAYGIRSNQFKLKPASQCHDLNEMNKALKKIKLPSGLKILLTGKGKAAGGALETLSQLNLNTQNPEDFIYKNQKQAVLCQIGPEEYTRHKKRHDFEFKHFIQHPEEYESNFLRYAKAADVFIACHFWDPKSPVFFTKEDMKSDDFNISVIADVSCDLKGPIPSTLRTSSISDPFYDYNPQTESEEPAFTTSENITIMAVDNLPGELPRDASADFGKQLIQHVLQQVFEDIETPLIQNATILKDGKLSTQYSHLHDYLNAKE